MRYREITEARPWKTYRGQNRQCLIACPKPVGDADYVLVEAEASFGHIFTGRTETFHGYYVRIHGTGGDEWIGEHPASLRIALRLAARAAREDGWEVLAIGLDMQWQETGLSFNSGWGYHAAHPERRVHMLEPLPPATLRAPSP